MRLTDRTRRLGETLLVLCVSILLINYFLSATDFSTRVAIDAQKKGQVATIANALRLYHLDQGRYPGTPAGFAFCEPFDMYDTKRCLGELLGPYIQSSSVSLGDNRYVYVSKRDHVFVAADITNETGATDGSSCRVGSLDFWCIKLPK